MVIQRWQSVLLLVAAVLMGINCFIPVSVASEAGAISAVLAVVTIVATVLTVGNIVSFAAINFVGLLLPVAATVLTVVARRCINRDKKLLNSYDRLR
jgi:uncharacterized Tic20 family protein